MAIPLSRKTSDRATFADVQAIILLEDARYQEQLKNAEKVTAASAGRIQTSFNKIGAATVQNAAAFDRAAKATRHLDVAYGKLSTAAYVLGGSLVLPFVAGKQLLGGFVALTKWAATAAGTLVTLAGGLAATAVAAVAYHANIKGFGDSFDEMTRAALAWFGVDDGLDEKNQRLAELSNRLDDARQKTKAFRDELVTIRDAADVRENRVTQRGMFERTALRAGTPTAFAAAFAQEKFQDVLAQRTLRRAIVRANTDLAGRQEMWNERRGVIPALPPSVILQDAEDAARFADMNERMMEPLRRRSAAMMAFGLRTGALRLSETLTDPLAQRFALFDERMERERGANRFGIGSVGASQFTRFAGLGGLQLSAQKGNETEVEHLRVAKEAKKLLEDIKLQISKGVGVGFGESN